ncbi:hypothetical protein BK120_08210 [Paenibacillus sp. FSL A5-0031]|nr:hypothetical protein BK120_08210 [Paenibacillus sp. FSL A5-0031]
MSTGWLPVETKGARYASIVTDNLCANIALFRSFLSVLVALQRFQAAMRTLYCRRLAPTIRRPIACPRVIAAANVLTRFNITKVTAWRFERFGAATPYGTRIHRHYLALDHGG